MALNVEDNLFSAKQIDNIAIVSFKKNLIRQLTNLNLKEILFDYLHEVSDDEGIKIVLILGSPEKIGGKELIELYGELSGPTSHIYDIAKIYNAINQFILMIHGINKMVVHADNGEVLSLFLNISLACDYRIIGDKTLFQYPTLELGLVPKGGGIFFLSKNIGSCKTMELLLSGKDITAQEALEMGLVDKVVPSESLYEAAIQVARNFARKPMHFISDAKKLLNFPLDDLAGFLERENELLLESVRSEKFRNRLEQQLKICAFCKIL
jgi:2-(1,2-epoxy-1,2-dihydrophenyl)acetyl-CoA isomerase